MGAIKEPLAQLWWGCIPKDGLLLLVLSLRSPLHQAALTRAWHVPKALVAQVPVLDLLPDYK